MFINLNTADRLFIPHQSAHGADVGNGAVHDDVFNFENVKGGSNDDEILGSSGANMLDGGDGNDFIAGLGGRDILTGGQGNDTFYSAALSDSGAKASTRDVITDFHTLSDTLDLSSIDANSKVLGDQLFQFTSRHGLDPFTHHSGELRYQYISGGNTIVSGDVNGDGKADFSILLAGHVNLQGGDFVL